MQRSATAFHRNMPANCSQFGSLNLNQRKHFTLLLVLNFLGPVISVSVVIFGEVKVGMTSDVHKKFGDHHVIN